jgi:uncharacterized protein with HEPN domain
MSRRSELLYLGDMLEHARRALNRVQGMTREEFDASEDLRIVVAYHITIVGEAASNVAAQTRETHPEIPWIDIAGMRNRLVHGYFDINVDLLWTTATERLPPLITALEKFTPPEPPSA